MKSNYKKKTKIQAFIAAILIFLFLDPYFMWNLHNHTPLYAILGIPILLLFYSNSDIRSKGRQGIFVLFSIVLIFSALNNDLNVLGFIALLCVLFVPFAREDFARVSFDYFITIYAIVIGVSSVVWILSFLDVIGPSGIISPLNELKDHKYYVYPLVVRPDMIVPIERFCGPFDEPGVSGTISAIILIIGKFKLKDLRLLVIFLAGILTLSLFYVVICSVYYFIYTFAVSKNKVAGVMLLLLLAIVVITTLSNELLYDRLWSRFLWDADSGSFAGDNRYTEGAKILMNKYMGTLGFLFGIGKTDELLRASEGEFSLLFTILQYGLLFVLAYILVFALYGWKYRNNMIAYLLFLLVFMGSIYQRPDLFQPEYLFLYSMMAMSCGDLNEKKYIKIETK